MSDTMIQTPLELVNVTIPFGKLEQLMKPQIVDTENGPVEGIGKLEHAWHFLQVYCGWGLRLPSNDTDFKLLLNTDEIGAYDFYPSMKEGASLLKENCRNFISGTMPKMVQVGNDLASFAQSASNNDGEMFKIIIDLLDGEDADPESALDLIQSLRDDAEAAIGHTKEVQSELGAFKAGLTEGSAKIEAAKESIEKDSKTNLEEMEKLASNDPKVAGSLAQLRKAQADAQALYDHNVVVAATSPTYAWVFPFGTIAGITVATVYGVRATEALEDLDKAKQAIKEANAKLDRAVNANATYTLANSATSNILRYTDRAIETTTEVQNGWNGILQGLGDVAKEIGRTMKTTDEGERLMKTKLVIMFLKRTEEAWRELEPALTLLTKNPYVTFEPKPMSPGEVAAEIRSELENAA
jgi:uncharacterized phage infection (PIP) family protein YhgE